MEILSICAIMCLGYIMKNSLQQLNENNFVSAILANNGYFCEHFPWCFNTNDLSKKWNDIGKDLIKTIEVTAKGTYPLSISMSKEGLLRRQMYIPNIVSFLELANYLGKNYKFILSLCNSKCSESKITHIRTFDYPSNFRKSIYSRNARFVGYKYKLKLDIANCFNSIYTHSISWACVGKEKAKSMYNNKNLQSIEYKIGDKIDELNSNMNATQTNGLLTGPFTSKVTAEIILTQLDKILKEEFDFVRFVDDYNFYFSTQEEANSAIPKIASILNEYNLLINKEKIQIIKFPFDILDNFDNTFQLSEDEDNVYVLLQKAYSMASDGNVGALKYLLKSLSGRNLANKYLPQIYGLLINTMITFPLLSPYVVNVIELYLPFIKPEKFNKQMNKILSKEIMANHDHEVLWLLYIILKAGVVISEENIKGIFKSSNDLAIIMCLDYLNNNFMNAGYKNLKDVGDAFNNELIQISNNIKDSSMTSKNWLLIYTIAKLDLRINKKIKLNKIKQTKLYQLFAQNDINFYQSFYLKENNVLL